MIATKSKLADRKSNKKTDILNINKDKKTTYKLNAKSFRMTEEDIEMLKELKSMNLTKGNNVTEAKIVRALIKYAHSKDIDLNKYMPM